VSLLRELGAELVQGDLTDAKSVERAVAGCRYVVHCAARVSDWGTVAEIRAANTGGTRNVLEAARRAHVERVVHVSTTDVYGHPGGRQLDEDTPYAARFRNWYTATKIEAEQDALDFHRVHAGSVVVLRPATVYGPRSTNVVLEIADALRRKQMMLVDGGRAIAGLVYVGNVVDAVVLALGEGVPAGQPFNVSDGLPTTWKQFVDALAERLGCPPVTRSMPYGVANAVGFGLEHGYRALRGMFGIESDALLSRQAVQVMGVDQDFCTQRARSVLGWSPRTGLDAGLDATVAWLNARDVDSRPQGSGDRPTVA